MVRSHQAKEQSPKKLALRLEGIDLYTGAMYRSLALLCINSGVNLENAKEVTSRLPDLTVAYVQGRILLNDADVTEAIQDSAIAEGASIIAVIPEVRKELVRRQQAIGKEEIARGKIVVVEGRDIGTTVFPQAVLKIYLTATVEVRAKRRLLQYSHQENAPSYEAILAHIKKRDERDSKREIDPLAKDPEKLGYFVLDNSDMSERETIDAIIVELKRRKLLND